MGDLAHNTIVLIYVPAFCSRAERLPPPLGLLYLGAALRGAGFAVRLFDFQDKRTLWEDVEDCIRASANPLIGITCDSDNKFRVLRISDEILLRFPNARVVLGGPHATYGGDSFVTGRRMLIRGEGEWPIVLLADYVLRGHGSLASIPQLVFEHEGEVASVPAAAGPFANVDSIPFPDYALLSSIEMYQPTMTTSRGCSYRCHFCSEGTAERGYRPRSIPEIERELVALRETYHGRLPGMAFADDTFTASPRRVLELCDVFDRVFPDKADFGFFCEGRVNVLGRHPELVSRLREAGMVRMQIGIEAGDQPTLDRINKRIRIEDIERVINACRKADVPAVHGAFICGLPGQTEADVMNEIEFAKRLVDLSDGRLETSMVALSALPGTEFCVNAGRWGLHLFDSEFASGGLLDGCFSETELLPKSEIIRLCRLFNSALDEYILEK